MSTFKVGDRVVLIGPNLNFFSQRGEVIEVDDDPTWPYTIQLAEDVYPTPIVYAEHELELESVIDALSAEPAYLLDSEVDERDTVNEDVVSHPTHYTSHPSGVECKDIVGHYPFFVGSAIKYLWRAGLKSEDAVTDLRKAIQNIEFEIQRLGGVSADS